MRRRDFLERVERLSLGVLGASLSGCGGFYYVNPEVLDNRLAIPVAEFAKGRFVLVDAPRLRFPLFVYRDDDGNYSTVSTRCMHRGCQVEPGGDHLVCPCHGSEYSNTGAVLKGPTQRPLQRLATSVEAEHVVIELPAAGDDW